MKHVEMRQNNLNAKKNNNRYIIMSATIFTLAIIAAAPSTLVATPTATTTTATSNATTSASALELSPQPVWEEVVTTTSMIPINETHIIGTFSGNSTLNLPNGTEEAINITSTGSVIASIMDGTAVGEEVISTVDGTESATQKFFGIPRFNMEDDTARAIVIAVVHTNSTGRLAPFNGIIIVGTHEGDPNTTATFRYWEWLSGIPLLAGTQY